MVDKFCKFSFEDRSGSVYLDGFGHFPLSLCGCSCCKHCVNDCCVRGWVDFVQARKQSFDCSVSFLAYICPDFYPDPQRFRCRDGVLEVRCDG